MLCTLVSWTQNNKHYISKQCSWRKLYKPNVDHYLCGYKCIGVHYALLSTSVYVSNDSQNEWKNEIVLKE